MEEELIFTPVDAVSFTHAYESAETAIDEEGSIALIMHSLFGEPENIDERNKAFMPLTYATFGHLAIDGDVIAAPYDCEAEGKKVKATLEADAKSVMEKYGARYLDQVTTEAATTIAKLFPGILPTAKKSTQKLLDLATLVDTHMHGRVAHLKLGIRAIKVAREFTAKSARGIEVRRRLIKRIERDIKQLERVCMMLFDAKAMQRFLA